MRVTSRERSDERLFDLVNDPDELADLSEDPQHEGELERLRGRMAGLCAELDLPTDW